MFRKPTQNRPGFITVGSGTINKKLVDGPDEEVLEQKSVEPAYKVQPYGSSTKLFTNAYRVKPTGDVKLGEPFVSFRPPESEALAWKRAEDENRRVQKTVDAIFRAEKVSDFVNRIYTPKAVEVSGLQGVMDSNSDTIRAAVDVINNTGAASKPLNYPPTQMPTTQPTGQVPTGQPPGQPPSGQPTGQIPSGKPAGQQPAQIPSVQPAVRVPSGQPAVIPRPPTSSGLSILDEVLSAGYGVYGFFLNDAFAVGPVVMYEPDVGPPVSIGVLPSIIGPVLVNGQGAAPYYFGTLRDIGARRLVGWNEGAGLRAVSTMPLPGAQPITKSIDVHLTYQSLTYSTTLVPFIAGRASPSPPFVAPPTQPTTGTITPAPTSGDTRISTPTNVPGAQTSGAVTSGVDALRSILESGTAVNAFILNNSTAYGPVLLYKGPTVPQNVAVLADPIGPVLISGQGASPGTTPYYITTHQDIGNRQITPWVAPPTSVAQTTTFPVFGALPLLAPFDISVMAGRRSYDVTLTPAQSTALVTTSTALVISPTRRTVQPLTDEQIYTTFFVERYNPPPPAPPSTAISTVGPDSVEDETTIAAINTILFDGKDNARSKAIFRGAGVVGLYESLKATPFKNTEVYALAMHDLQFVLDWDDDAVAALGQNYTATVAYELLRDAVIESLPPDKLSMHIMDVAARCVAAAEQFLKASMTATFILHSEDLQINPWVIRPILKEGRREWDLDSMDTDIMAKFSQFRWAGGPDDMPNNPKFYALWLLRMYNQGYVALRDAVGTAVWKVATLGDMINFPAVTTGYVASRFGQFLKGLAQKFFSRKWAGYLASAALNFIQNRNFMNFMTTSALFGAVPIAALYATLYGQYQWSEAGVALSSFVITTFNAFRSKGRAEARDLRDEQVRTLIRVQHRAIVERTGRTVMEFGMQSTGVVGMLNELFALFNDAIDAARESVVPIVGNLPELDRNIANNLNNLGLSSLKMGVARDRDLIKRSFSSLLSYLGVPEDAVTAVIQSMTSDGGTFSFYTADDKVSEELFNALTINTDRIKTTLSNYFKYKSKLANLSSLTVEKEALRQFTQKFGENRVRGEGSVFKRMSPQDRDRWYALLATLFGLPVPVVTQVINEETFADAIEPEDIAPVETFRSEIAKFFNPENSIKKIVDSAMPFNYKWFAIKRRRGMFKNSWGAIFRAMGADAAEVTTVINSLDPYKPGMSKYDTENRSGIRTNGRHGIRDGFNQFLERNIPVFSKFMAAFSSADRVKFAKTFFARFFGLRGFRPLVDKVFALSPDEYKAASPSREEQIDVVQMDATYQDGDKPDIPEPTDEEIEGYGVPWPLAVSRGSMP